MDQSFLEIQVKSSATATFVEVNSDGDYGCIMGFLTQNLLDKFY
jgi:hypothetical protein